MEWLSVPPADGRVVVSPLNHPEIERIRGQWYQTGQCSPDVIPHLIATIDALNEALIGIIHIDEHGDCQPRPGEVPATHPGQRVCQEIARNTLKHHSVPVALNPSM